MVNKGTDLPTWPQKKKPCGGEWEREGEGRGGREEGGGVCGEERVEEGMLDFSDFSTFLRSIQK